MIPTTEHLALWNEKGCRDGMECMTGILDNGGGEAMILEGDMPRHFSIRGTGHLASAVTLFAFCPICGRSLKPNAPRSAGSAAVDLLRESPRPITEDDVIRAADKAYDLGRKHGHEEAAVPGKPNAPSQASERSGDSLHSDVGSQNKEDA